MVGGWVVGGMRANTETSRSSARARAATTMSTVLKLKRFFLYDITYYICPGRSCPIGILRRKAFLCIKVCNYEI